MSIHPIDTAIVIAYMAGVTLLGMWIGRSNRNVSDYLLGNRNLPWWAVLGSIVATETSTATFLSVPGLAFAQGGNFGFLQLALGFIIGRILISIFLLPQYFKGQLFTAYEVLHKRFGGLTQRTASLLFLVTRNLGDGLRLFLTAIVLQKVADLNLTVCIVVIGIATIAYTFVGGMKAVVWNDCLQLVVYLAGGVAALLLIENRMPGGWQQILQFATVENKLQVFDTRFDLTQTYTLWAGLFGGTMLTLGTHGTDQMMVQRYLCTGSQSNASRALILSGFVVFVQFVLFLALGTALACFYASQQSPPQFDRDDEVLATFIVQEMPKGLVGLTLAAVFSAAMSTLSSSLNSSAGAVVNDFLKHRQTQEQQMTASRWLTICFGVLQIGIGIAASEISRSVVNDALAIAGFSAGLLLGVFVLGVATKHVGQVSAMVGILSGACTLLFVKFGNLLMPAAADSSASGGQLIALVNFCGKIAWPYYAIIGATTTIVTGLCWEAICTRWSRPHKATNSADSQIDSES